MSNKKGSGLKLAGGGRKIQYAKRQIKRGYEAAKPYIKEGYQNAKPYLKEYGKEVGKNIIVPAMKNYLEARQKGGFVFTIAALIAAGIAAAKAVALGAAGAMGALAVNKMAGRGLNPDHIKTAIERVSLTVKDFSPSVLC